MEGIFRLFANFYFKPKFDSYLITLDRGANLRQILSAFVLVVLISGKSLYHSSLFNYLVCTRKHVMWFELILPWSFYTAIPSRGDICLLNSKNIQGTFYSGICLHNCLRMCQRNEFQEPAQGNQRKRLIESNYVRFDHIQFVQIWTPTPCGPGGYMRCVNPLPPYYANNFSMHGLWPAAADGTTLQSNRRRHIPAEVVRIRA